MYLYDVALISMYSDIVILLIIIDIYGFK